MQNAMQSNAPALPAYVNGGFLFGLFACEESAARAYAQADALAVPELADTIGADIYGGEL